MKREDASYRSYLAILKEELVPATGCTEPIAIAYAAAVARSYLGALPEHTLVEASGNLIKNVHSVVVPNTGHQKGIPAAAAAGIIAGDPKAQLQVISEVSSEQQEQIRAYAAKSCIDVELMDTPYTFDLRITESAGGDSVSVRITSYHTNIVTISKNGQMIVDRPITQAESSGLTDRSMMSVEGILEFAECADLEDVEPVLQPQIDCNLAIAEEGLRGNYGANIGSTLLKSWPDCIEIRCRAYAAAASDARMNGCEMPVIINSGSGNQGITASVPVIIYAREKGCSREALERALLVSNLCTIHQKTRIGRLSAFCGAISAGAGAGAGICYLEGGGYEGIIHTIVNALAADAGVVCDGAKASCAAKISIAVEAGIFGMRMWQNGQQFYGGDGLVSKGVENTIRNIGALGHDGMKETDREILRLMLENDRRSRQGSSGS